MEKAKSSSDGRFREQQRLVESFVPRLSLNKDHLEDFLEIVGVSTTEEMAGECALV